ncbi:MAG: UDP-glycosyltransferase [Mariniphaga sp.]|nr:UDP-glycosyltransferase [Mariniphaga sp.]
MKILITNHWLKKLGGSETFTYTLVKAAKEYGAEVDLFTIHPGIVSDRIQKDFGVKNQIKGSYDFVLANHHTTVFDCFKKQIAPIIQTCHGTIPKLEKPSTFANAFVAISEEIACHVIPLVSQPLSIIRNSIDINRFSPEIPVNPKVENVLSLSFSEKLNDKLNRYFTSKGIGFKSLNKHHNPVWDVEKYINQADLVIALGRGAYEAFACGRPVLVLDHRPYQGQMADGSVHFTNIDTLARNNFSGRTYKLTSPLSFILDQALASYNKNASQFLRSWALKNLHYQTNFLKYIDIWKTIK